MSASAQPPYASLQRALQGRFGSFSVVQATALGGGLSAQTQCLTLALSAGRTARVVLKSPLGETTADCAQRARREFGALSAVAGVTSPRISAPEPLLLDVTGEVLGKPGMVLSYLEGAPDFAPRDLAATLEQTAHRLAQIHQIDVAQAAVEALPLRADTVSRLLAHEPRHLDHTLDEPEVRNRLHILWPKVVSPSRVLLHGDYWPGNLVWQRGRLTGVLDWEEAEVGDPLSDLSVARLDVLWAFGWEAVHALTRHYLHDHPVDTRWLPVWDLVAALRPMSKISHWASVLGQPPIQRCDLTVSFLRERHRQFVVQALQNSLTFAVSGLHSA